MTKIDFEESDPPINLKFKPNIDSDLEIVDAFFSTIAYGEVIRPKELSVNGYSSTFEIKTSKMKGTLLIKGKEDWCIFHTKMKPIMIITFALYLHLCYPEWDIPVVDRIKSHLNIA